MTHLRIELSSNVEIVVSNTIHKLYELVYGIIELEELNQILTSLVSLSGNLLVNKAYGDEVDWLNAKFGPNLQISVTESRYIKFADPLVGSYWANSLYGDGIGITEQATTSITKLTKEAFSENTNLISFDELSKFTNIKILDIDCFKDCSNLLSVDARNITKLGRSCFSNCSNLDKTDWDLSNVTSLGLYAFYGCSKLKGTLNLSGVLEIDILTTQLFYYCSSLKKIIIGHMSSIFSSRIGSSRSTFYMCDSLEVIDVNLLDEIIFSNNTIINNYVLKALIIRNTETIPTITLDLTSLASFDKLTDSTNAKIYVDDNLYSTYINHADWSDLASHIEPLSNYTAS